MTGEAGARSLQRGSQATMHPTLGTRQRAEPLLSNAGAYAGGDVTAGAVTKIVQSQTGVGAVVSGMVLPPHAYVPGSGTGQRRREGQAAAA